MCEIIPLSVELIEKDLGFSKFNEDQIRSMEKEILQVIQFKIPQRFIFHEAVMLLR